MRKLLKLLAVAAALAAVTVMPARAAMTEIEREQYDALDAGSVERAVPESAADMLDGLDIESTAECRSALSNLMKNVGEGSLELLKTGVRSAALIVTAVLLSGFATSVAESVAPEGVRAYAPLAGVLAVAVIAVGDVRSFIGFGSSMLGDIDMFSKALLPTLSASAAASGAFTSAAAKCAAAMLFIDFLIGISEKVILPLVYAYVGATVADAAFGGKALSGAAKLIKWIAVTLLTVTMLAFVVYMAVSGVVSGTADAAATRMTKTALGTMLPVVGGIISDAAGAILSGASLLRNSIGVFGMLAVLAICLLPFIKLAVHYLCYKAAAGISLAVAEPRLASLVSGIGSAFGIVMGMTGACAIMVFLSVISLLQAVSPI